MLIATLVLFLQTLPTFCWKSFLLKLFADKQLLLLGDFKSDLLKYNAHAPIVNFVSLLFSKQLLPYVVQPSRVSENYATVIANIFSNICNQKTVSGNQLMQSTDHFPHFFASLA